jgi:DNA-binding NarL/FixJ family response regulator
MAFMTFSLARSYRAGIVRREGLSPGPAADGSLRLKSDRWHNGGMAIRILIADDHAVVRQGLRMFLALDPDLEVVGEAEDGAKALEAARGLQPDVVLMDMLMPVMDGVAATRAIRTEMPDTEVIALTSVLDDNSVVGAVKAGAIGYLLKDTKAEDLCRAIKAAAAGQVQLSPQAAARLVREVRTPEVAPAALSERETEVLRLVARGKANKEIAAELSIGEKTVKTHVSSILNKLGVQSRTQAALYAAQTGIVPLESTG